MREILGTYKAIESFIDFSTIPCTEYSMHQHTWMPVARVTRISLRIGHEFVRARTCAVGITFTARPYIGRCTRARVRYSEHVDTFEKRRQTHSNGPRGSSLKFYMRCVMARSCTPSTIGTVRAWLGQSAVSDDARAHDVSRVTHRDMPRDRISGGYDAFSWQNPGHRDLSKRIDDH